MKKLMLAAAVAAVGASSVLADVYNVKFTAKTPVDVENKSGITTSLKSITVQGLWNPEENKYAFWTVNGSVYAPIKNVTFALVTNAVFYTKGAVNNAQVAEEWELLWGDEGWTEDITKLSGVFVASGLAKNKADKEGNFISRTSLSGSFAGQIKGGPAYGSWSVSRNASATKKTTWEEALASALPKKLEDRDFGTSGAEFENAAAMQGAIADANAKLEAAKGELADLDSELKELGETLTGVQGELADTKGELADTKGKLADTEGELADTKGELADTQGALDEVLAAVKQLNDPFLAKNIASYLEEQYTSMTNVKAGADEKVAFYTTNYLTSVAIREIYTPAEAALTASNELLTVASNAFLAAQADLAAQQVTNELANAIVDGWEESDYYAALTNDIAKADLMIAKLNEGADEALAAAWDALTNATDGVQFKERKSYTALLEKQAAYDDAVATQEVAQAAVEAFVAKTEIDVDLPTFEEYMAESGAPDNAQARVDWAAACAALIDAAKANLDAENAAAYAVLTNDLATANAELADANMELERQKVWYYGGIWEGTQYDGWVNKLAAAQKLVDDLEASNGTSADIECTDNSETNSIAYYLKLFAGKKADAQAKVDFAVSLSIASAQKMADASAAVIADLTAKLADPDGELFKAVKDAEAGVVAAQAVIDDLNTTYSVATEFGNPVENPTDYDAAREAKIAEWQEVADLAAANIASLETAGNTLAELIK